MEEESAPNYIKRIEFIHLNLVQISTLYLHHHFQYRVKGFHHCRMKYQTFVVFWGLVGWRRVSSFVVLLLVDLLTLCQKKE
jgi:hypothetical protein